MPLTLTGLFLGLNSYVNKKGETVKLINVSQAQVLIPSGASMPTLPALGQLISLDTICTLFDRNPSFRLAVVA